jgi:uncharacterized damage-inducible protein DinB
VAGSLNGRQQTSFRLKIRASVSSMNKAKQPEPWLRGTLTDVPAVQRAVLHALELAAEDLECWCCALTDDELNVRRSNIPPVAFHIRHIARSMDRLLTYAEGNALSTEQIGLMKSELNPGATRDEVFAELKSALERSAERIRSFSPDDLSESRTVGRQQMPTTVGGLLVHFADHTQRHVGQAITTAKIVKGYRGSANECLGS